MIGSRTGRLEPAEVAEVLGLAEAAAGVDGTFPLAEDAVLRLRHGLPPPTGHGPPVPTGHPHPGGEPPAGHLLVRDDAGLLAGYAQVLGETAELVVRPDARRRGIGRALAAAATERCGAGLRIWAHGDHPGAAALARALGARRDRVLHQLRRSLSAPLPEPVLPAGVTLRAFRPGVDDQAWLAVNAHAFAGHPEQGGWTADELRVRMAEPWFDPVGFLLAERDGHLLGFHWTKVHDGDAPIGEVYVLGVDPAAHGLGLGAALTLAGLRHLRNRGLDQAMLYVDESNPAAMALYTRLGFAHWSVDVTYAVAPRDTEPET